MIQKKHPLFLVFILLCSFELMAQPHGGGPGGGGPPVPISGIEILIGGGAIIGMRKFLKKGKPGRGGK